MRFNFITTNSEDFTPTIVRSRKKTLHLAFLLRVVLKVLRLENFLQPESERAVSPDCRGHIERKPSKRRRGRIRERWIQHHPRRLPRVRVHGVHQPKHSNEYWSVFTFIQLRSVFASVRLVGVVHEFWNEFPIRHAVFCVCVRESVCVSEMMNMKMNWNTNVSTSNSKNQRRQ